jgi:hypothetical protein
MMHRLPRHDERVTVVPKDSLTNGPCCVWHANSTEFSFK